MELMNQEGVIIYSFNGQNRKGKFSRQTLILELVFLVIRYPLYLAFVLLATLDVLSVTSVQSFFSPRLNTGKEGMIAG